MVKANLDDEGSLKQAFEDANYIFAVIDYYEYFFKHDKFYAIEKEFGRGCNIARAAAQTPTLERYMWSTLPNTTELTGGKAIVPRFEGKGKEDDYMRLHLADLIQKTTFLISGIFTGIFVYGLIDNHRLAGKYIKCTVEEMTIEESMEVWDNLSCLGIQ